MKHQLMQHCAGFISAVTLHVSGASAHHQEYLKTSTAATGTRVIVAGKSSHLLIRAEGTAITGQDITHLTHYNRHAVTSVF